MAEREYDKQWVIKNLDACKDKTLGEIDNKGIFEHLKKCGIKHNKGVAGTVIEQCVFGYPADNEQKPDLIIVDENQKVPTELKTTGLSAKKATKNKPSKLCAKEPMSITAVSVTEIVNLEFETSAFWEKLHHTLFVYYQYLHKGKKLTSYDYHDFPIVDYQFHQFNETDKKILEHDWNTVKDYIAEIWERFPPEKYSPREWKKIIEREYKLKKDSQDMELSYINIAPRFPPRFRLNKPVVNAIAQEKLYGTIYEKLRDADKLISLSEIDLKLKELTDSYQNKSIDELAQLFGISTLLENGKTDKSLAEQIVVKMFGGNSKKINQIELFNKFGLIAKNIALTEKKKRTEDIKLFRIDFDDLRIHAGILGHLCPR